MRVMVIVKASADSEAGALPEAAMIEQMHRFNQELIEAGIMLAGEGLQSSARGKRVRFEGGRTSVIDGPFAETKELIAGFWLWQVKSMDEAIEWARRCPPPHGGTPTELEIRQVFENEDFGDALSPEIAAEEDAWRKKAGHQAH